MAEPGGWERVIERYDRYSLLGFLVERGVSEQALSLMGPLFNLEGRYHFSLVEWFAHWHEDVFGDLEFIDAGADTLADRVRAGAPRTTPGSAPRSTPSSSGPDDVVVHFRDGVGTSGSVTADECILTVPFVLLRHMEIERPRRRQVVHDPERLLRPGAQDLHAVQPPLVGRRLRHQPRRDRDRPRHPQRRLHPGRPGPRRSTRA